MANNGAEQYIKGLGQVMLDILCTNRENQSFSFSEGMEKAMDLIVQQSRKKKKIMFIGNGGSASICSHQSVDYWKNGKMKAIALTIPVY